MIQVQSSQRQVRKKYSTVNGCTHRPSLMQILAILFMIAIIILQANILGLIFDIADAILSTATIMSYILLILIIYDYTKMVMIDPVDPRLVDQTFKQHPRDKNLLVWCDTCKVDVHKYSYHCKKCDRCVEEFDHHCKYVNNCVGRQNYLHFFRIVVSLICYLLLQIGQGLWVVIKSDQSKKWVGMALVILSRFVLPSLVYLAAFHCYISFFEYGTTLRYLKGDPIIQNSRTEHKADVADNNLRWDKKETGQHKGQEILIVIPEVPQIGECNVESATHLRKTYYLF